MNLFIFGPGYAASAFVRREGSQFSRIAAAARDPETVPSGMRGLAQIHSFAEGALDDAGRADIERASHILTSVPPDASGDPVLRACGDLIASSRACSWIGYLSSVAVYGDRAGGWVDEDGALDATSERGKWRIAAERSWEGLRRPGRAVHLFRLAGIYGPERNALVNVSQGKAKRLIKPGQVFNRIHVDDIAQIIAATLDRRQPGGAWNVADDEPAAPQDVVSFAAGLLGLPAPPETPFDAAKLTPMAASFYADNKRVANAKVRRELGLTLRYPTYREGLRALHAAGEGR
ncbi:MAG: SDR family oxidoreductase [Beijerinckiaceae bacterium]